MILGASQLLGEDGKTRSLAEIFEAAKKDKTEVQTKQYLLYDINQRGFSWGALRGLREVGSSFNLVEIVATSPAGEEVTLLLVGSQKIMILGATRTLTDFSANTLVDRKLSNPMKLSLVKVEMPQGTENEAKKWKFSLEPYTIKSITRKPMEYDAKPYKMGDGKEFEEKTPKYVAFDISNTLMCFFCVNGILTK